MAENFSLSDTPRDMARQTRARRRYEPPRLDVFGTVEHFTRTGAHSQSDSHAGSTLGLVYVI